MSRFLSIIALFVLAFVAFQVQSVHISIKRKKIVRSTLSDDKVILGELKVDGIGYGRTWEIKKQGLAKTKKERDWYVVNKRFTYEGGNICADYECLKTDLNSEGNEVHIIPFNKDRYADEMANIRVGNDYKWRDGKVKEMEGASQAFASLMTKVGEASATLEILENFDE